MRYPKLIGKAVVSILAFLAPTLWAGTTDAQVKEVTVGVTPSCPYGLSACWAGAYEALGRLDGVKSVAEAPDVYNCTARLYLTDSALPDPDHWAEQFKARVGGIYVFRGVEVTVEGTLENQGDGLVLRATGIAAPIPLTPLHHKLQWNFRKAAARQPEPDERDAYQQLAQRKNAARPGAFPVLITGPLEKTNAGLALEVREFFPMIPTGDPYGRH